MAEIGSLEYILRISTELAEKDLKEIEAKLKQQDEKLKNLFGNIGAKATISDSLQKKLAKLKKEFETTFAEGTVDTKKLKQIQQLEFAISKITEAYKAQTKAVKDAEAASAKLAKSSLPLTRSQEYRVQKDNVEKEIIKLTSELKQVQAKITASERLLIPTGELKEMAALARKLQSDINQLNVIKSKITEQLLPSKLSKGTVDFGAYINQLTQVPFELQRMNEEYAEMERQSNKQIEIEKKRTIELQKQFAITQKQKEARFKQLEIVDSLPEGSVERMREYVKYLELARKHEKDTSKRVSIVSQIAEEKQKIRELIAAKKEQIAIEQKAFALQKLQAAIDNAPQGSIVQARAQLAKYVAELRYIRRDTPNATDEITRLTAAIAKQKDVINQLQPLQGIWGKLKSAIISYATAYLSVQGAIASAQAFFRQTKELDQLGFAMKTVIKNSSELAQTQKFLSDVASNYGGDLLTLSERYIKFRAAAQQSNMTAAETQKIFDTVSKAAGTLGLKTDELSGVYLALEQMISKGKVTTEELRRQLGERLPGAFGIMANALGVTLPQLDKMLKKGEVLSKDALPKFAAALEKAYGIESLKKIDTLAAAQGRLQTNITGLIKAFDSADELKRLINSLASVVGFFKDNANAIIILVKAFSSLVAGYAAIRIAIATQIGLQKISVLWTGRQIKGIVQLSEVQLLAATTARSAAAATTLWSRAFQAFGGWVGIVLSGITALVTAIFAFTGKTKETADAMAELTKGEQRQLDILNRTKSVLSDTTKGTERYKNALQDVNNIAAKYNKELLTEQSTRAEINKTIQESIALVKEDYAQKRKVALLNTEEAAREAAISPLLERMTRYFEEQGAVDPTGRAIDQLAAFRDYVAQGFDAERISKLIIGGTLSDINLMLNKAIEAEKRYITEKARIEKLYPEKPKSEVVDIDALKKNIEDAKDEFEKISKIGKEKLAAPKFSEEFRTELDYLKSLQTEYAGSADALELIALRIAEITKEAQKGGGTGKTFAEIQAERLENQITIVKRLKEEYDKLAELVYGDVLAGEMQKKFGESTKGLGFPIDLDLTDEKFQAWAKDMIAKAEKIGGEAGKKLAESLSGILDKNLGTESVDLWKNRLDEFDRELDLFEQKQQKRESIFNITGDEKLAVKLAFDTTEIIDTEKFVKDRIVKLAEDLGAVGLFDGTYESLIANVDKVSDELRKKIEAVQKYLFDRQEKLVSGALEFVYKETPEGVDIQFDFSKVVTQLNSALDEIKKDVQTFTSPSVLEATGLTDKQIREAARLQINATNEVARNAAEKLGKDYIKENLPEQLKNDFEDMQDASIQSIRDIIKEIEKMKAKLLSGETVQGLFDKTKLDKSTFQAELDLLIGVDSLETLMENIDKVKANLVSAEQVAKDTSFSKYTEQDIATFRILVELIEKLGVGLEVASRETKNKGLEKFAKSAKELQDEIFGVYDSVLDLSDALGVELTDSSKAALESVKDAATGIFGIIEGAALLATESISAVEKASAILMVISAAVKIGAAIAKIATQNRKETEAQEQAMIDIAYEYNKALKERNLLLEQAQTIFGTDEYGAAISQLTKMQQAQDDLAKSLEKIRNIQVVVGRKDTKWWEWLAPLWTSQNLDIFGSILQKWPELIKDGALNLELAKSILSETNSGLSDAQKRILQEGIDATEQYKAALDSFNDYLSSVFGQLGSNLMTAITDNLDATINALDSFTEYASSALEKLFSDLAYSMYLAPIFADLQKQIQSAYTDAIPDDATQVLELFKTFGPMLATGMEGASEFLKTIQDSAKLSGFDLYDKTDEGASGIRGEIKGIQEETARRLEGLLNSVRETGVVNMKSLQRIVDSNDMINGYAAQSLTHLINIDANIATQLSLFVSLSKQGSATAMNVRVV